ncbi:hypothetical protein [Phytohalomonas tamaricis]|uniref:hypothetical protein n=1 Tax=Phytohalomonas tamaricis TaxID=2081032 RepID=UPI000D0B9554|nr:hypothetical protein [Phytohalomonas tamaricis]
MCGLCGLLNDGSHWSDPLASTLPARQLRYARLKALNKVLTPYRLKLTDFQGSGYVLSSLTGRQEMVSNIDQLWRTAETLSGRTIDPLDPELLATLENHCASA